MNSSMDGVNSAKEPATPDFCKSEIESSEFK